MQIARAAADLNTTPRMLRYRERLGLVTPLRRAGDRRDYSDRDVAAAALAARLEERYGVSPKALAFGIRVLADPEVEADVRRLGVLAHRLPSAAIAALDFDAAKGRRLLFRDSR